MDPPNGIYIKYILLARQPYLAKQPMSQDDMALVEPMPPLPDSTFSRFNAATQLPRRGSDVVSSPTCNQLPIISFDSLQSWLSTSPTGGLDFLAGDHLYNFNSMPARTFGENGRVRAPLQKSRSFPKARHEDLKSTTPARPPLRKSKSVKFADSQGLPLVEAVHELTRQDSSYTARKIVPYADEEFLTPVQLLTAPKCKSTKSYVAPSAAENNPQKPTKRDQSSSNGGGKNTKISSGSTKLPANCSKVKRQNSPNFVIHRHKLDFIQPSLEPDFFNRVSRDCVCLERIHEEPRSLHGVVRVANLAYAKEVTVRWTHDNWKTSHDTHAVFLSNDGATDRFAFELPINGDDVSFAIQYRSEGAEYWDNNRGSNYTVLSLKD